MDMSSLKEMTPKKAVIFILLVTFVVGLIVWGKTAFQDNSYDWVRAPQDPVAGSMPHVMRAQ